MSIMSENKRKVLIIGAASTGLSIAAFTAMSADYPLQITAEAKQEKAIIRISGMIWQYNNSAASFERQIDAIIENGITDAHLIINTPGGDVFQANDIANQIERFKGTITGESGALLASAGTYIASAIKDFEMPENAQYMYHKPKGHVSGDEDQIASKLKLLKSFTADYKARYVEISTNSAEEIEANWSKGDVWLTAKEAKKQGFISGVKARTKITSQDASLISACGSPTKVEATITKNKPENNNEMDLKIAAVKIGLPETATQAEYDEAILALSNKANKVDQLQQTVDDAAKEKTTGDIKAMFDKAIVDKKITAEAAKNMQGWAEKDPVGCKAHIDSLVGLTKPKTNGSASETGDPSIEGKKFEELTPEQAAQLEIDDPEKFMSLYEVYIAQ